MQITPANTFVFLCHVFIKKKFDFGNHCLAGFNTLLPFLSTCFKKMELVIHSLQLTILSHFVFECGVPQF